MSQPDIRVRRIYDRPSAQDGARVLVDRIWPRGVSKAVAQLDDWAKDAAPSAASRVAQASPMPLAPPVTTATRPASPSPMPLPPFMIACSRVPQRAPKYT